MDSEGNNPPPKSSGSRGWKRHLLSSGVPLEFEVARLLTEANMYIDADFSFMRRDGALEKELSVDISCSSYEKYGKEECAYKLAFLIECKYRSQDKKILLLPIMGTDSPVSLGGTTFILDHTSKYHLPTDPFTKMEAAYPFAYKAIEIHEGSAIEHELRHGIQQLRYATPELLRREIEFGLGSHMSDTHPTFIAKILVSNAPLYLLDEYSSLGLIESAKELSEIAEEIQSAIIYSDYGPDYEAHFRGVFNREKEDIIKYSSNHADQLSFHGKDISRNSDPRRLLEAYSKAERYYCRQVSTQFFITNLGSLSSLIRSIKASCREAYKRKRMTDPISALARKYVREKSSSE